MIKTLFLIGSGVFFGSIFRYLVQNWVNQSAQSTFPWGTFFVNILGSLLISMVYAISDKIDVFSQQIRLFFAIGFCGGFTIFSTFANENLTLINNHQLFQSLIYSGSSVIVSIIMLGLGFVIVRHLF